MSIEKREFEKKLDEILTNGLPRNIDNLGRLTIPMAWRKNIQIESQVEVFRLYDGIFIRPIHADYRIPCKLCETKLDKNELKQIDGCFICPTCLANLVTQSQAE